MKIKYPSPSGHLYVSLIKSALRLFAGVFFILSGSFPLVVFGLFFILAEALGVLEEFV